MIPLHDRLSILNKDKKCSKNNAAFNNDKKKTIINRWRSIDCFKNESIWHERLRVLNTDEDTFAVAIDQEALKNNIHNIHRYAAINVFLQNILSHSENKKNMAFYFSELLEKKPDFSSMLIPVLEYAYSIFEKKIRKLKLNHSSFFCIEQILKSVINYWNFHLKQDLAPALVAELHYASKANILRGRTSEDRFKYFEKKITNLPSWIEYFYSEYPVLLLLTYRLLEHWSNELSEIMTRIDNDIDEITSIFNIQPDDQVLEIWLAQGDYHYKGRSVSIIHFESGKKLVYKPHSTLPHNYLNKIMAWLIGRGLSVQFKPLKTIDRGNYGWIEFIFERECLNRAEVKNFYKCEGAYLAIFYVLRGYDLIQDNIISEGKYPHLIDLECISAPIMPSAFTSDYHLSSVERYFQECVNQSGFLPQYRMGTVDSPGIIAGGLIEMNGQIKGKIPVWKNKYSDKMHQGFQVVTYRSMDSNIPRLNKGKQVIYNYVSDFIGGFTECYSVFLKNRNDFLANEELKLVFKKCQLRILFRDTYAYAKLREEAMHPENVKNALEVDYLLEHLWNAYSQRHKPEIIQSEIEQLWQWDIPLFWTKPNSKDLYDSNNNIIVHDYFSETAIEGIYRRLQRLSKRDMEQQVKIIKKSIAMFSNNHIYAQLPTIPQKSIKSNKTAINNRELLGSALALGDYILKAAIPCSNELAWIDVQLGNRSELRLGILSNELYDGIAGIALFFHALAKLSGIKKYSKYSAKLTEYCVKASLSILGSLPDRISPFKPYLSPYSFPSSTLYLLINTVKISHSKWWELTSRKLFVWLQEKVRQDVRYDHYHGGAGLIHLLIDIFLATNNAEAMELAFTVGENILKNAKENKDGIFWLPYGIQNPYAGFAHGNAGISWALTRLHDVAGEKRYRDAAIKAINFSRKKVEEIIANIQKKKINPFFCNGIVGYLLAIQLVSSHLRITIQKEYISKLIDIVLKFGFGNNHCICHGDLGNLEILFAFANKYNYDTLKSRIIAHLHQLVEKYGNSCNWTTGLPNSELKGLGLMNGMAGIGYELLRFIKWDNLKSVLILESPFHSEDFLHKIVRSCR